MEPHCSCCCANEIREKSANAISVYIFFIGLFWCPKIRKIPGKIERTNNWKNQMAVNALSNFNLLMQGLKLRIVNCSSFELFALPQGKRKRRSNSFTASYIDGLTMRLQNVFHNCKSQSCAALLARTTFVNAIETLEQTR